MGHEDEWKGSSTLREYVYNAVKTRQTETKEFKALQSYYGLERLRTLYKEQREIEKSEHPTKDHAHGDEKNSSPIGTDCSGKARS